MEGNRKCLKREEYQKLSYKITCAGYFPNGCLDGMLCELCPFYIGQKKNRTKTITRYKK